MPTRFEELVQSCITEAERLDVFVNRLSDDDLETPSACTDWAVGDVLAHLTASAGMFARILGQMAAEDQTAEMEWRIPNPDRQAEVAEEARAFRRERGNAKLRAEFRENNATFIETLNTLRPEDADKTSTAAMGGRRTVYQVLGVRIGEIALHGWDMQSKLTPDFHLSPVVLPTLMGYLAGWRMFSFQKREPQPSVRYRWVISGDVSAIWDLEIDGESFRHTRDTSDEPDVIFRTDGEAYVLTGVGRMDLFEALASGRIKAEGPAKDIEAYASHFPPL